MLVFGLLLATSLAFGILTSFGLASGGGTAQGAHHELGMMLALEFFDAILVGVAVWKLGRPPRWPRLVDAPAPVVWVVAFAGLFLTLGVNSAYHELLKAYLRVTPDHTGVAASVGITPAVILAHCAQPALVEELFFRYLLLDNLRRVMRVHAAVGVSSLLFGFAHIGVPLSIPVLIVVGLGLGYARVLSGRLELPMVLHFLHNGIILVLG
jgi:membrane protease YdiL (CAAX protease family)